MHAEAASLGHGIDEAREGRAPEELEIIALGVAQGRDRLARQAVDRGGERLGVEAGAVHKKPRCEPRHLPLRGDFDDEPVLVDPPARDAAAEGDRRSVRLRIAEQRQHEGVAVENAGRGRQERAGAGELGLELDRPRAREELDILDAIGARPGEDALERPALLVSCRHDQLATAAIGDAMRIAIGVKRLAAGDA